MPVYRCKGCRLTRVYPFRPYRCDRCLRPGVTDEVPVVDAAVLLADTGYDSSTASQSSTVSPDNTTSHTSAHSGSDCGGGGDAGGGGGGGE